MIMATTQSIESRKIIAHCGIVIADAFVGARSGVDLDDKVFGGSMLMASVRDTAVVLA